MPPSRYGKTRILSLEDAWDVLEHDDSWEIAERYSGGRLKVGTPPIRPKPQVGGGAFVITSPSAKEGETGIRTQTPQGPAGATWVGDRQQALTAYEERLRTYSELTAGEERLFRVELVVDGAVLDQRIIPTGEISPDPDVLDGLSLTYIGVLASIALALAFGIQGQHWWGRILIALATFLGLSVALRAPLTRCWVTRFSRWTLPGAHET